MKLTRTSNIRVNLSRDIFLKHLFPRRLLNGVLISATLISIILYTLQTFLTPKRGEYFIRVEIRQRQRNYEEPSKWSADFLA